MKLAGNRCCRIHAEEKKTKARPITANRPLQVTYHQTMSIKNRREGKEGVGLVAKTAKHANTEVIPAKEIAYS